MKSHLAIPIAVGDRYVCVLATATFRSSRAWPEPVVQQVRVIEQILANALYRKRAELELRAGLDEISRLEERLEAENVDLRGEIESDCDFDEIVGRSRQARSPGAGGTGGLATDSAVLLLGETGTGKELLARLNQRRRRRDPGGLAGPGGGESEEP